MYVNISYSWGESEPFVEIPEDKDPFEFTLDLALKEARIEAMEHCGEGTITLIPYGDEIVLGYTDGKECHYRIES